MQNFKTVCRSFTQGYLLCSDPSHEDSPELLPPPPDVGDNRQCALCLNYGDENTNVSHHSPPKKH